MIIRDIHIDGFGIFNGFSLDNLENGVNILIGNNEVGKSTLLQFIRFTLFGYPRKTEDRMAPLNGGNHGGRIKTLLHSGKEAMIDRKGNKSVILLFEGNESKSDSQWYQLLGNANAQLFNNIYAFSLNELINLDTLTQSGIEDKIFSVSLGLGDTSVAEVEGFILSHVEKIYSQRGRSHSIHTILEEIRKTKVAIELVQDNLPKYQTLSHEIVELENSTTGQFNEIERLRTEKSKIDNYMKCHDSCVIINTAEDELKNLPPLQDLPEEGISKLDVLELKEQEHKTKIDNLKTGYEEEKGIDELKREIENIEYNTDVFSKDTKVQYLRENQANYKQSLKDKNAEEKKVIDYQQSINQGLKDIDSTWKEQNISSFVDMVSHKNKISKFKDTIDKTENEKRSLEAEIKAMQARRSSLNVKSITITVSLIFIIGSIPFFLEGSLIWALAFLLIGLISYFSRNFIFKENPEIQLQDQLEKLTKLERDINNEYGNYLEHQLNLPKFLDISSVFDVFEIIMSLRGKIAERDNLNEKIKSERLPFIKLYEKEASDLKGLVEHIIQNDDVEVLVPEIIKEYDEAVEQADEKRILQEELNRKHKELERTETNLRRIDDQIENLLSTIKTDNRYDFRSNYQVNNKVRELTSEKTNAIKTIEKIIGINKSNEVIMYFEENEKVEVEEELDKLNRLIETNEREYKEKNTELGAKKHEIGEIEGESELAELFTELETHKQRLFNAYNEWLAGELALKLLQEVKAKYEKEKQPDVIKYSNNYFNKITGDKYKRVSKSLEKTDINVYDSRDVSKQISQLSRGTKEQLLISLRLGAIEEYEKKAEPLPIVVDEILVNFDPQRAKQVAEIFHEFGRERQILIFTCHPETINYFKGMSFNKIIL